MRRARHFELLGCLLRCPRSVAPSTWNVLGAPVAPSTWNSYGFPPRPQAGRHRRRRAAARASGACNRCPWFASAASWSRSPPQPAGDSRRRCRAGTEPDRYHPPLSTIFSGPTRPRFSQAAAPGSAHGRSWLGSEGAGPGPVTGRQDRAGCSRVHPAGLDHGGSARCGWWRPGGPGMQGTLLGPARPEGRWRGGRVKGQRRQKGGGGAAASSAAVLPG